MENEAASRQDSRTVNTYLAAAFRHNQDRIALADGKANILLGIVGLLLSLFIKDILVDREAGGIGAVFVIVPFVVSGAFALITVFPRIRSPKSGAPSLLFFDGAKELDVRSAAQRMTTIEEEDIFADYIANIQALSSIVSQKFKYLRWGYIFLAIGFIFKVIFDVMVFA